MNCTYTLQWTCPGSFRALDTITVSFLVLVVIGMAKIQMLKRSYLHYAVYLCSLLWLGHFDDLLDAGRIRCRKQNWRLRICGWGTMQFLANSLYLLLRNTSRYHAFSVPALQPPLESGQRIWSQTIYSFVRLLDLWVFPLRWVTQMIFNYQRGDVQCIVDCRGAGWRERIFGIARAVPSDQWANVHTTALLSLAAVRQNETLEVSLSTYCHCLHRSRLHGYRVQQTVIRGFLWWVRC